MRSRPPAAGPDPDLRPEGEPPNAAMRRRLQERTGKSLAAWVGIARSLGTPNHADVVAWLRTEGRLSNGYASMIAHEARRPEAVEEDDPLDLLFAGPKVVLRPLYDAVVKTVSTFGRDIEFLPKKANVSIRRQRQFALFEPSTPQRADIGLVLRDTPPAGRLEAAGTWNGMVSHRVRLGSREEFDKEVMLWMKRAYDQAA